MGNSNRSAKARRRIDIPLLCAAGLLINFLGVRLAKGLALPLYLDIIGTALAGALGGYIPGIVVGFLTNLINGIGDYETAYYGSLSVLIAISSAWFSDHGYYGKPWKLPVVAAVFALIGGGLGSVLTWALYGFDFGSGVSAPLVRRIFETGKLSRFWSQFSADMLVDLADKAITVAVVAAVLHLMPAPLRSRLYFAGWQQAPLSRRRMAAAERKRAPRSSLRKKITVIVVVGMLVIAVVVTGISYFHFRSASIDQQTKLAESVVNILARTVDANRVDEFIEKGEDTEGYAQIRARLQDLMESSEDVEYVYVYRILEDGCHVVFDPDTPDTPGNAPGTVIPFDDAFQKYIPALLAGQQIEPVISNGTYGWLLTVYRPLYDDNGVCQCYGAADINMNHVATDGYQFLARVVSLFFGFFLLVLTIAIWLAEYNIILPINTMDIATSSAAYNSENARSETLDHIRELDIRTGDEIESLYHSVVKTTEDMVDTVEDVEHQGEVISKLQNGLILVLADLVESRDKCTGDHVRKTAAYADIIMRQLKKEGVYADQLTEEFMQGVVKSAPLHDVGKIVVADALLNKPGRLTDDEFARMKQHTTSGAEIIARAMDMVSEENSGYLKEARDLAFYHHEKWDGTGYPRGLKGEAIPLSARIMAVADVFDALVSKRSYKDGFSYEKAAAIIEEGSGTHFDPKVVAAFLHAQDEVRRVMVAKAAQPKDKSITEG